ncbi:SDR family oxidoreductase [uncultured Methanolobus sp.]|uniref:SDR family NAD(P)-dependent oxidoreductase n=1 Tax=uncultured Methanolobus sp. TaxID=218300 RepID=UPI0029C7CF42|nr:SDR family oxidoreductase [uncultured Methanolobus sp.]
MFDVKGKKILVTGASTGIGACTAELLASRGATVGLHYNRSSKEANDLLQRIYEFGGTAAILQADLLDASSHKSLVDAFICSFGGLDVLVNNAGGIHGFKHFLEMDDASWDDTFMINVKAPFFIAKEAFAFMKDNGGGKIINISSISAKYGGSSHSMHYGAAKAALDSLTKGMSRHGAEYNILVNSIRAGFVDTPFHKKINRQNIDERVRSIPLKKAGEPIDIARMVLFLASEAGDYVTGETFTVAGGD